MEGVRAVGALEFWDTTARVPPAIRLPWRDSFGEINMERLFHFQRAEG